MLLLQCRHEAFPKLDNLVPSGKMKIILIFVGLLGNSIAMPMQMPRIPGFSSKSEEMMRYSQFSFMNSPHMTPLGPMYGNGVQLPQLFPQYQIPMWPQPPPTMGNPQKPSSPSAPKHQSKTDQTPETQKPNQPQPKKPPSKRPLKQPTPAPTQPQEEDQPPQAFPPFGNGLFPYQQPPWQIPHRVPPGYGRPPVSNEEGGNPYFGYFGYHGFGGRPPYYSEEMFEQDFEKPKEKDPPKTESPATEPSSNSTVPGTNSTKPNAPNPGGNQGGNDTSTTGNSGHGTNTASNPTTQNGVATPPAVNVSGQGAQRSQIPWGPHQPNIYEYYPNPNIQSFPAGRQWRPTSTATGHRQIGPFYRSQQVQRSPRWNSFAWEGRQAVRPGNPIYRRPYASTARGNSPSHAGNPANFRRKPQGPNKHPMVTNVAPLGPKHGTVGRNEKIQNPRQKPLGQKEKIAIPTRDPTGPWRNSQDYGVNKSNYKLLHPEGNVLVPNFNSIDQHANSYYPRGDSRIAPNSDGQTQSQNLPKGIILEPRRIPYESETNRPEVKQGTYQPAYPEEIPSPTRENFPAARNSWNHQEIIPPFKEDPGRQEELLPTRSHGSRGVYYADYNPYDPRENSPYIRSNTWADRDDSPNTRGQPENPSYPVNTPGPKETVLYNEEDPIDPTGDETFPRQSRWEVEESSFKENPTVRHYEGEHYTSNQPKEYLPYSLDNPSKPRADFPYGEFYPWNPDENLPSYNTVPTLQPPVENRGYYANSAVGPEENTVFPSWNSWDPRMQAQGQREKKPYFNRNFWDQPTQVHKGPISPPHQKENEPYSSNSPAGLQKNPTWREGENLNYGMQITRLNSPEGEHLTLRDLIPPSYSSGPKEAHLFHLSQRGPCCAGGSIGHKDNLLALQDHTPSFGLATGENQDTSPLYTKDSHTKHARHTISPTSTLPSQRNSSENRPSGESPNPSPFRDDVSTLRRNIPCSIKNQLDQRGIMPFSETSSLQSKNMPCLKSDLGGDGNNVLDEILEGSQLSERTAALTPEQLVIDTPDEGPKPEGLQTEVQGNEEERQQERPSSILQLPCFGSKLAKYLSSSTGTPFSIGRQGPFNGDPMMPTEIPNSLAGLPTGAQFQSINVDPVNADEHTPFDSVQIAINPKDKVQDCLLLQA